MAKHPAQSSSPKAPEPATVKYCPRCFRTEPELGPDFCGNFALKCPDPIEARASEAITVRCGPCDKTRTVPVGALMQRKHLSELGSCVADKCLAHYIIPSTPAANVPPPIKATDE